MKRNRQDTKRIDVCWPLVEQEERQRRSNAFFGEAKRTAEKRRLEEVWNRHHMV